MRIGIQLNGHSGGDIDVYTTGFIGRWVGGWVGGQGWFIRNAGHVAFIKVHRVTNARERRKKAPAEQWWPVKLAWNWPDWNGSRTCRWRLLRNCFHQARQTAWRLLIGRHWRRIRRCRYCLLVIYTLHRPHYATAFFSFFFFSFFFSFLVQHWSCPTTALLTWLIAVTDLI